MRLRSWLLGVAVLACGSSPVLPSPATAPPSLGGSIGLGTTTGSTYWQLHLSVFGPSDVDVAYSIAAAIGSAPLEVISRDRLHVQRNGQAGAEVRYEDGGAPEVTVRVDVTYREQTFSRQGDPPPRPSFLTPVSRAS